MTAEIEEDSSGFLGSTSLHVMRKCPCPVWVMKPAQGKRFARILAAVDTGVLIRIRSIMHSIRKSWTWRRLWPNRSKANCTSSTPGRCSENRSCEASSPI